MLQPQIQEAQTLLKTLFLLYKFCHTGKKSSLLLNNKKSPRTVITFVAPYHKWMSF